MKTHKNKHYARIPFIVLSLLSITACSRTNEKIPSPTNSPVPGKMSLKFGGKVTFTNYSDKYFTGTNIYYSNDKIYIKIESELPYNWTINEKVSILVYYNADDYKTFSNYLSGFLNADKQEIEYVSAEENKVFYLFFNINDYPHMEAEKSGVIINFGGYTQENSQYESYDISRHLLEYNFG